MSAHPNGVLKRPTTVRPPRNDAPFFEDVFPDSYQGKLLKGLLISYLIKLEHRRGWTRNAAYGGESIDAHPNETVAAHQWGVAYLVSIITLQPEFDEEIPNFDKTKAMQMALIHDVPELVTGDITPVDGISPEEKHKREREAMELILGSFSEPVKNSLHWLYNSYEQRICPESKFVKDCDRLDFIIHAFLLERQGFEGIDEFYCNSTREKFSTRIAEDLANTLIGVRNSLKKENVIYRTGS